MGIEFYKLILLFITALSIFSACDLKEENGNISVSESLLENNLEILPIDDKKEFEVDNLEELDYFDFEIVYDFCKSALTDLYYTYYCDENTNLDLYFSNNNLKKYMEYKIDFTTSRVKRKTSMNYEIGLVDVNLIDNLYNVRLAYKLEGGDVIVEGTEFIVSNEDGKLVIIDIYTTGASVYFDDIREAINIEKPFVWNDDEWVTNLFEKIDNFDQTLN